MRDPKARQRQLERKRRKREQRLKAKAAERDVGMDAANEARPPGLVVSTRSWPPRSCAAGTIASDSREISAALADLAQFMVDAAPGDAPLVDQRSALLIVATVWNELVTHGADEVEQAKAAATASLARQLPRPPAEIAQVVEEIARRKLARYSDDDRIVVDVAVAMVDGKPRITAAAMHQD